MAGELTKQTVSINFAQGIDTKTDPWQLPSGKFTSLINSVFSAQGGSGGGRLNKRNGFGPLAALPNGSFSYLTTLNNGLLAVGDSVASLSSADNKWYTRGQYQQLGLSISPTVRNSQDVIGVDSVVANGLVCTVWTQQTASAVTGLTTTEYLYQVTDQASGQNVVLPTSVPTIASYTPAGSSKVFSVGPYFVVVTPVVDGGAYKLQYFALSSSFNVIGPQTTTSDAFVPIGANGGSLSWDGCVSNNTLIVSYNTTTGGQGIHTTAIPQSVIAAGGSSSVGQAYTNSNFVGNLVSSCVDSTNGNIYVSFYNLSTTNLYTFALNSFLNPLYFSPQPILNGRTIVNIASCAFAGTCSVFYEIPNSYSYESDVSSNYVGRNTITSGATIGTPVISCRSIGLASKAFFIAGMPYYWGAYQSQGGYQSNGDFQPTNFLIRGDSLSSAPQIVAKVSYENCGGYLTQGLPSVTVDGDQAYFSYLFKDLAQALVTLNNSQQTTTGGIYTQTGVNLGSLDFSGAIDAVEQAGALHMGGGFLQEYDGQQLVEHNFLLWPDNVETFYNDASIVTRTGSASNGSTTITLSSGTDVSVGMTITDSTNSTYIPAGTTIVSISGTVAVMSAPTTHAISGDTVLTQGNIAAQPDGSTNTKAYYYEAIYAWTDAAGMTHRSAPSTPVSVTTTSSGTAGSITVFVPTLRLTKKVGVRIEIYRWSVANQSYFEVTLPGAPLLNDPTVDNVTFVDVYPDPEIVGNQLIYTTGGVVEDINAPASNILTSFDTRLWLVDAEDPDLFYFSKTLVEGTPVEMSDLLTYYVQPSLSAQGPTGKTTAAAPMDDKLVIFKQSAIYYINGTGPDSTGANSEYSQPIFVVSPVGCNDQKSIVMTPTGLQFQASDGSGLWLLNRSNMQVEYVGASVEAFNAQTVNSSVCPSGTTQVRSTLNNGAQLAYDYYYNQWSSFQGAPAVSSCIYQGLHTIMTPYSTVLQETPGLYADATTPVRMSFTTGWISMAGLQGYERLYEMSLLANYQSPHGLLCSIAYDFNQNASESKIIRPTNRTQTYGQSTPYGAQTPYGGPGQLEQWDISVRRQTCQAFQITIQEIGDPFAQTSGAGLTISGLALTVGLKKGRRPIGPANRI